MTSAPPLFFSKSMDLYLMTLYIFSAFQSEAITIPKFLIRTITYPALTVNMVLRFPSAHDRLVPLSSESGAHGRQLRAASFPSHDEGCYLLFNAIVPDALHSDEGA